MEFRWNQRNAEHIAEHGIYPDEAEFVIRHARRPFPRYDGDGKYRVWGKAADGIFLQVLYVYDPPGVIYVIHARPMNDHEKRLYRRSQR